MNLEKDICSLNNYAFMYEEESLREIKSMGFKKIEYHLEQARGGGYAPEIFSPLLGAGYHLYGEQGILCLLERFGVKCAGVSAHCELAGPEAGELLKARLASAKKLGADYVSTGVGQGWQNGRKYMKGVYDTIAAAAGFAESIDIILAVRTDRWITSSARNCIELLNNISSPNLKIAFDPGGYINNKRLDVMEEEFEKLAEHVAVIYLKDAAGPGKHDIPLGAGAVDFTGFFAAAAGAGYAGRWCYELINDFGLTPDSSIRPLNQSYWVYPMVDGKYLKNITRRLKTSVARVVSWRQAKHVSALKKHRQKAKLK